MSLLSNDDLHSSEPTESTSPPTLAEGAPATVCPACDSPIWLELRFEKKLLCAGCSPPSVRTLCDRAWHVISGSYGRFWDIRDGFDGSRIGMVMLFGQEPEIEEPEEKQRTRSRYPLDPTNFEWDRWSTKRAWGLAQDGDGAKAWKESITRYAKENFDGEGQRCIRP